MAAKKFEEAVDMCVAHHVIITGVTIKINSIKKFLIMLTKKPILMHSLPQYHVHIKFN